MEYLVTGAAGFIGHRVAQLLLAGGHQVLGIDNLNDAYDPQLKRWRLDNLQGTTGFAFQKTDITHRDELPDIFDEHEFDAVFNLAARAGVRQSTEDPWAYMDTNGTGTLNLLELCRKQDVSKLVLASTSSLYGEDNEVPFREDANTNRPLSPYAASKKAAEGMAASYSHLYDIDTPVFRYFTVYGPAGRPDMSVFRFIRWIAEGEPITLYGDGTQSRDFTYVDDIARGTVAGLDVDGFEIINLGNDTPVELNDMIALVEKAVGKAAKIVHQPKHPADVDATWADITKARKLLGWDPRTTLQEGIERSARWYDHNRSWARQVDLGVA